MTPSHAAPGRATRRALVVAAGLAVYGLGAQLMGAMDLRELKGPLRRPPRAAASPSDPAGGPDLT